MVTTAVTDEQSLNGTAPVNTYIGTTVGPGLYRPPTTYLYHDHRVGEDVCFLAVDPFVQHFRRSPSRGVIVFTRGAQLGIHTRGDCSKAKISNPRATGGIYEDIRLGTCQYRDETGVRPTTHPLKVPVNHITGVEVTEALGDVRQLIMG